MDYRDFILQCREFEKSVGRSASFWVSFASGPFGDPQNVKREPLTGRLYPNGLGTTSSPAITVYGETPEDCLAAVKAKWEVQKDSRRSDRIRAMALKIIDLADSYGECTDHGLRISGFTDAEITEMGSAACTLADRIAGRMPFSIAAAEATPNAA